MSDTPSKKNSIFDKALLGTAGFLAIGMMALGPRGDDNPSLDNEKLKMVLEAKEAELAKLRSKLASVGKGPSAAGAGKAVDDAREQKEQLIKNLEKLLKKAKSGN